MGIDLTIKTVVYKLWIIKSERLWKYLIYNFRDFAISRVIMNTFYSAECYLDNIYNAEIISREWHSSEVISTRWRR